MIDAVYIFTNGMVGVFNEKGQQIPELQKEGWDKSKEAILANSTVHTKFFFADWGKEKISLSIDQASRISMEVIK